LVASLWQTKYNPVHLIAADRLLDVVEVAQMPCAAGYLSAEFSLSAAKQLAAAAGV